MNILISFLNPFLYLSFLSALDRIPNTCYATRTGSQNYLCGTVANVLAAIKFSVANA
jgi:hypothetical protein